LRCSNFTGRNLANS